MAADIVELACGPLTATLAPQIGGSIASFRFAGPEGSFDLMRPAVPGADDPLQMASFPLVPFSNRIGQGQLAWRGRVITLPRDPAEPRHALHGHGWRNPWEVIAQSGDSATLLFEYAAADWPWDYSSRQEIQLTADALTVDLSITNESHEEMPCGFGLHPYFPRVPGTRILSRARGVLLNHDDMRPREVVEPPPEGWGLDGDGLLLDKVWLDNCYTGWQDPAVIVWPDRPVRLRLEADGNFGYFVVYNPLLDYFCAEAVSQINDSFNMEALGRRNTGMKVLAPGETVVSRTTFRVVQG